MGQYIFSIRKQHTVNKGFTGRGLTEKLKTVKTVHTLRYSVFKISEYRRLTEKLKTVKTVHTLRYSVLKISEYFRGVVFCESFGMYGAVNLGIWCSVWHPKHFGAISPITIL